MKSHKKSSSYNKKLIVGIILTTLVLVIGTSYAFFTLTLKAEKELSVTTGTFRVDYKDQNRIELDNAYPMSDAKGMSLSPYEFSIENTGDIRALYDISLETTESSNLDYRCLKYSIKKNEEVWSSPKKLTSLKLEEGLELDPSKKDTYQLRLWIDESVGNEAQGKVFIAKVVVNSVQSNTSTKDVVPPVITLNGSLSENIEQGSIYTDPGVESASDDRDILEISDVKVSYKYLNGETTEEIESIDTSRVGVYYIYYTIKDASGNEGRVVRSVNVYQKDSRPPEIRLNGKTIVALNKGEHYEELGATARKEEEDLTSRVVTVGTVNEKRTGAYEIKYLITDQIGNTASIVRVVNVVTINNEIAEEITLDLSNKKTESIELTGENIGDVSYTSEDESIATVDESGIITGKSAGSTIIKITTNKGIEKEVRVIVQKTVNIVYVKQGRGVSEIGKTEDSCVITSGESCEVESPSISVASGYTAVGWSQNSEAKVGVKPEEKITLSENIRYYSISYRNQITRRVIYNIREGVKSISKSFDSCIIERIYNNDAPESYCRVTLPLIEVKPGYSKPFWSKTEDATSGSSGGVAIALTTDTTNYYAKARDITAPEWSLVRVSPSSGTITPSDTLSITFKGTDASGSVTSTLSSSDIRVKVGSAVHLAPTTLSTATNVTNGKQYTLTIKGIHENGIVSLIIGANTLKDASGNASIETTLTTGVTMVK